MAAPLRVFLSHLRVGSHELRRPVSTAPGKTPTGNPAVTEILSVCVSATSDIELERMNAVSGAMWQRPRNRAQDLYDRACAHEQQVTTLLDHIPRGRLRDERRLCEVLSAAVLYLRDALACLENAAHLAEEERL